MPDAETLLESLLPTWPTSVVALGVVTPDGTALVGTDVPLPWASVTKLVTAWSALLDVAAGALSLDDAAGPPGATLRHLLAHASGLGAEVGDAVREPERRRIYSNAGYEALAAHCARVAGVDVPDWLRDRVLAPLGMCGTALRGSPASGLHGPASDLARFAVELRTPSLLPGPVAAQAVQPQWPRLDGVLPGFGTQKPNLWGLGPELRGDKRPHWTGTGCSPRTYGHFGQSGSFVWVDPDAEVALFSLCDRPFGEWARDVWPPASDAVLDALA